MKIKKRTMCIIIIILIIIAMICLLPWPTRIDLKLDGAIVNSSGDIIHDDAYVEIHGWKYDYLLRPDAWDAEITLPDFIHLTDVMGITPRLEGSYDLPYIVSVLGFFNNQFNTTFMTHAGLDLQNKVFIMRSSDPSVGHYFVGSTNFKAFGATEILDHFSEMFASFYK